MTKQLVLKECDFLDEGERVEVAAALLNCVDLANDEVGDELFDGLSEGAIDELRRLFGATGARRVKR